MKRLALLAILSFVASSAFADPNFPRFRGVEGSGHVVEPSLPVKWDGEGVAWRAEVPGRGQSSPIVWGERLFVTTALDGGKVRATLCYDRRDGKRLWQQDEPFDGTVEELHKMNSWATSSCATDGERVVSFFGRGGIHCYDLAGKKLWSQKLGAFAGPWGTAASPVFVGELVVQNCDAEDAARLVGLDKRTGTQVWSTPRRKLPRGGWSTPILIDAGSRQELVLNGEHGVQGYDPKTGAELWYCKSFNGRGEPVPAFGHGLLYVVNGLSGDMYAVRPGGSGDVTSSHMAWHLPRKSGRDLPSPILVGDLLLVVSMNGIATQYDVKQAKELWKERLGGNFSGSPIAANGLVYIQNEEGETFVLRPGPQLDLVSRNPLGVTGEIFRASPAASLGQLFFRSDRAIYCVGKRAE